MNNKILLILLSVIICCFAISTVNAQNADSNEYLAIDSSEVLMDTSIGESVSMGDNFGDELGDSKDIYFDSSREKDGNGSQENPYKYLSARKLVDGCTAHFASGEYRIDSPRYIYSDITLVGENAQNTIIKYKGLAFSIGVQSSLTASGLTFKTASIRNVGTLDLTDCIFESCTAAYVDLYENSFGGAIYCKIGGYAVSYSPGAYITNCTFINNYAAYGGAIYIEDGILNIEKSTFINNSASGYGGAVGGEDGSTITISDSTFYNDSSVNDAGGAIYTRLSSINIKNSNFIECRAFMGGALCNLYGQLSVSTSKFENNAAKYDGGAFYGMYGRITANNNEFRNNSALNGGAVFIDNCTTVTLSNSNFNSNIAPVSGGAVFINAISKITNTSNTFNDNKALKDSDVHCQDNYPTVVNANGNQVYVGNYTDYVGELPEYYNLFDEGLLSPVKDQQSGGNCWGFSTLAALESAILKVSNVTLDLSEENLKNLAELYSAYGWKMETNQGGYDEMSIGYIASWLGPVSEADDVYDDYSTLSPVLDSVVHVQNIFYVPARSNYTDNDIIKQYILKYGAVSASYYHSSDYYNPLTFGYYYPGIGYGNHAITIIGWDDNYSKENFYYTPAGDGAFIIKNSWNETWGEDRFFYISYYDGILYAVGDSQACYGFIFNDSTNYTKNYQYDFAGLTDYLITGKASMWYANEFNATGNDYIAAFSTYFNEDTDYIAEVYVNGDLKLTQTGKSVPGYYTIPLEELIAVNVGDTFRISLKVTGDKYAYIPISEGVSSTRAYYKPGISSISFNGKLWIDLYDYEFKYSTHTYTSQVACIKAFTVNAPVRNTSINISDVKSSVGDMVNIIANVFDENNSNVNYGYVNFTIDNTTYTVGVVNGIANLTISFNRSGNYTVAGQYYADDYFNPSDSKAVIEISRLNAVLKLNIADIIYGNELIADIEADVGELILTVNGKTYIIQSGNVKYTVPDLLNAGKYRATLTYNGSDIYFANSTGCEFEVAKKDIKVNATVNSNTLNIVLSENINGTLDISIDDKNYSVDVVDGAASLDIPKLRYGNHTYNVIFSNDNYNEAVDSGIIAVDEINVVLTSEGLEKYYKGSQRLVINLTDDEGNSIANKSITIIINGVSYTRTTNENGSVLMAINLASSEYEAKIIFNKTGAYNSANTTAKIKILETVEGRDLTKVFRNSSQYWATFKDINGKYLTNGTNVSFNINGVFYTRQISGNEGKARLNINLNPGEYIITATNPDSDEMYSNKITVKSRLVENHDLVKYYRNSSQYTLRVLGDDGNPVRAGETVTFNINGVFYSRTTNDGGYVTLSINLYPASYVITAEYNGCKVSNNITVLDVLSAGDLSMNYKDGSRFEAKLLDGQGKDYANQNITFNINGILYTRTTDADGIAGLNINLMSGEYIITSSYERYNISNKITIR